MRNTDDAPQQLHAIILTAAQRDIKNETPQEVADRVKGYARAQDARRRSGKEQRSSVKQTRKKPTFD